MDNSLPIDFSNLPSKTRAVSFVHALLHYLFPHESSMNNPIETLIESEEQVKGNLYLLLGSMEARLPSGTNNIVEDFFRQLPRIRQELLTDAALFVASDPAVECLEEVIIAYPGFFAIAVYRVSNTLYTLKVPILPRIIAEYAHSKTGIDIHPGATISHPFFIDHGTGVVIGQTAVVGSHVKIYQGVTLGALAVKKEAQGMKRHPTIEDNVIIYAGSCVLGGDTVVGHDTVIGGNVWLTKSVPPHSVVYHKSEIKIREKPGPDEAIDFVI